MINDMKFVALASAAQVVGTPRADGLDGTSSSAVVSMENYREAFFLIGLGDATGGTATPTITVIPASTAAKAAVATAITFEYKRISSNETETAWVAASTLTCIAGDHQLYVIKVQADDLPDGYPFVYLNFVETVNDPVPACCLIVMANSRYAAAVQETVTT